MVTIKNISVLPGSTPNDGAGRVTVRCTVFTPTEKAGIERAWLDLRHTMLFREIPLVPDSDNIIRPSQEGDYLADIEIPRLFDTGRYRLPVLAADSSGATGRAEGFFRVTYRRPGQVPGIASPGFLTELERLGHARFIPGNRIEILESGYQAFQRRLEMIESAGQQINLQTYTLGHEEGSDRIVDALLAKVWKGVEVNIILNSDSQIPTSPMNTLKIRLNQYLSQWVKSTRQELEEKPFYETVLQRLLHRTGTQSVNLLLFRGTERGRTETPKIADEKQTAHWLERMRGDARPEKRKFGLPTEWLASFEGPGGLPGGLPALPLLDYAAHEKIFVADGSQAVIGGRNLEDRYFTRWFDLDLALAGPIVQDIQKGFLRTFEETAAAQENVPRPLQLLPSLPEEGTTPAMFVQSRPWRREHFTLDTLLCAIQAADRKILISSQYIILPPSLLRDAIIEAAGRGVDVRILTNSEVTCQEVNSSTGYFISLSYLDDLLGAGIRVFELKGFKDPSLSQPYFHVKEFLFDGELAAVGSFNLSMRSCYIESENLLFVPGRDFCARREEAFFSRLENECAEITTGALARMKKEHKTRIDLSKYLELLY